MIFIGDGAAEDEEDVFCVLLAEERGDARDDDVVGAGEDGEADAVDVLLDGGRDDHLGGLAEAGVDDLHASVAEGAGDDLCAAVVAVEAGLGYEDADGGRCHAGSIRLRVWDWLEVRRELALGLVCRGDGGGAGLCGTSAGEIARLVGGAGFEGAAPGLGVLPTDVGGMVEVEQESFASVEEAEAEDVIFEEGEVGDGEDVPVEGEGAAAGAATPASGAAGTAPGAVAPPPGAAALRFPLRPEPERYGLLNHRHLPQRA